jgi:hypothetical protein
MDIDGTVYPDLTEPPQELTTEYDKADYLARICGAWDFGVFPTPETFDLFAGWRDIFDRFPQVDSPSYATFRMLFEWPPIPGGSVMLADYERMEPGRVDPCAHLW